MEERYLQNSISHEHSRLANLFRISMQPFDSNLNYEEMLKGIVLFRNMLEKTLWIFLFLVGILTCRDELGHELQNCEIIQ